VYLKKNSYIKKSQGTSSTYIQEEMRVRESKREIYIIRVRKRKKGNELHEPFTTLLY